MYFVFTIFIQTFSQSLFTCKGEDRLGRNDAIARAEVHTGKYNQKSHPWQDVTSSVKYSHEILLI